MLVEVVKEIAKKDTELPIMQKLVSESITLESKQFAFEKARGNSPSPWILYSNLF